MGTDMCKTRLPAGMAEEAKKHSGSDDEFKMYGVRFASEMCTDLLKGGAPGMHFYTLNLEKVVIGALVGCGLVTQEQADKCAADEADAKTMVSAQGITTEPQK